MESTTAKSAHHRDEHDGCCHHPPQSHASQWDDFLRTYNAQKDRDITQRRDRFDFQDPFSVQVQGGDGGSFMDADHDTASNDWYAPGYVNIEYHSDNIRIKSLDFRNCSFASIPDSVWELAHLENVEIHAMEDLISLTTTTNEHVLQRSNLRQLIVDECYSLDKLPPLPDSLTSISIKACHRMTFLPKSIVEATNLQFLQISNMMLPVGPSLPTSLKELQINGSEVRMRKLKLYLGGGGGGGLQTNENTHHLKSLRLSMCDLNNGDLSCIWHEILPICCPNLQRLNLSGNNIRSLSCLVVHGTTTSTTRLRALHLEANPVVNCDETTGESNYLLALLEQNAELCCLGDVNWKLPLYQKHSNALKCALEDNFARILKASSSSSSSCPLALWSNVLVSCTRGTGAADNNNNNNNSNSSNGRRSRVVARCKNNHASSTASLIYNVLQGPAFVERLPHTYY